MQVLESAVQWYWSIRIRDLTHDSPGPLCSLRKKGKCKMDLKRNVGVLFTVLCLTTGVLTGQTYRGAIAGSVADSSGAAVADASVKIVNKGTGVTRTQNTPVAGDFNFPDLAPGI